MDPATIGLIVSALVPFLKKGGEKLVDKIVDEGFAERGKIWESVKGLFSGDDLITLDLLAENPDDLKLQGKVEGKLEDRLKNDPEAAAELEKLLAELKRATSTEIINEEITDSDVKNKLKRAAGSEGRAAIENEKIERSRIDNEIEIL